VLAFLRSLPPANGPASGLRFRPLMGTMMALGKIGFAPQHLEEPVTHAAPDRADPVAFGRYLALSACTECHGSDLRGQAGGMGPTTPDVRAAAAYSLAQFTRLMRESVPLDGRDLGLMKSVAQGRFSNFTDTEIAALHAYVRPAAAGP